MESPRRGRVPFRRARVPQHTDPEFFYLIIVGHIFFENTNVTNHLKIGLLNPDVYLVRQWLVISTGTSWIGCSATVVSRL
jgi:hypothetical protein